MSGTDVSQVVVMVDGMAVDAGGACCVLNVRTSILNFTGAVAVYDRHGTGPAVAFTCNKKLTFI
mgnify:CR=1 FL=1